ncbi:putative monooxygenase [Xylariaceae sp. FL1272]|nr:putative monooxygenase [Xylariaceae sp. FL1272]
MDRPGARPTSSIPFKAIIVGGGLVGLTTAHVLSKADIDFVVLEKHESSFTTLGSTLALWPQTLRIFDQLGLLDSLESVADNVIDAVIFSCKTSRISHYDPGMKQLEKNHGYGVRISHRPDMVRFLYESLPDMVKTKFRYRKAVVRIQQSSEGVTAFCDDGASFEGSIVIGADGVRSPTRRMLQAIKIGKMPDELPKELVNPYKVTFRCFFGSCAPFPGLGPNTRYDGNGDGLSTQTINGTNRAWFGLYEMLKEPDRPYMRYSEADKQDMLQRYGNLFVAPGLQLSAVCKGRIKEMSMIDLEEGAVQEWFHERIVLVGDAVRKLEPHAGLGYNAGVMDVVVLTNALRRLLLDGSTAPTSRTFDDLFRKYQADRQHESKKWEKFSMDGARILAWPNLKTKFIATWVLPYFPLAELNMRNNIAPLVSSSRVLDWLEERPLPASSFPWKNHPFSQGKEKEHGRVFHFYQSIAVAIVALIFSSLFTQWVLAE